MKHKKTWTERLDDGRPHQVKPVPVNIAGMKVGQMMLVPTARLVEQFIRRIPAGRSITAKALRECMAAAHGAEVTCPITTGFCLRTVAEATWEARCRGAALPSLTPVWRVLPPGSPTLKALSFDISFVRRQRALEGLDSV